MAASDLSQHLCCRDVLRRFGVLFFVLSQLVGVAWVDAGDCSGRTFHSQAINGPVFNLTDGPGNYAARIECEWLITASEPNTTITLTFDSYATECQYDYLFVYDGPSYSSPLVAAMSGDTVPPPAIATSGQMLVFFYSDTNYVLQALMAKWSFPRAMRGARATASATTATASASPAGPVPRVPCLHAHDTAVATGRAVQA
eukprot:m.260520 g.260520  ORF g.260520 m.260520 type:complete len:200 (-) comp19217_c1_seq1:1537-2136(-)